ncbi:MAG TPA: exodeoxyribonuclease V subunit gamma, partial [Deferrisomatales bacterium]|nr:exodeoxyribonuclease V subunit gamma [Deferrisomatales bacterium]
QVVVVPNQGTARWLAHRLAEALGVCANVRFPFPDQFLLDAARAVVGDLPDPAPFSLGVLPWRVLGLLPQVAQRPGGAPLAGYLTDPSGPEAAERKRLQLAEQLTGIFELYTVFRPDLLRDWEAGAEPGDWQANLWRALTGGCPGAHRATALERLIAAPLGDRPAIAPSGERRPELSARVHVFGVGALAPLRLRAFEALARRIEVNLYLAAPSLHYWADLRSPREQAREARRRGGESPRSGGHLPEVGNPLLASLGRQGRAFFDELAALPAAQAPDDLFADPGQGSLLACLQSDILQVRHRGVDGTPERELAADDHSLQFHACHSPLREVEALHDWLLGLFGGHELPGLEPRDVLVVTPDPETYAPYVQAVFDGVGEEACRIPYALADRGVRAANPLADGFLRLLAVPGSRFGAQGVLDLLEVAPLARRFGFTGDDRETVARWGEETRIRWGIDAAHRERCGVPGFPENSWRAGLGRLLLGYALPGDGQSLFSGVLPHGEVEGDGARVLGCLAEWAEALFALDGELSVPRSPEAWTDTLGGVLERFFAPDDDQERDLLAVRRALTRLAEHARAAGFAEPLSLAAVRDHLGAALEGDPAGGGTFTGRVTVASLRTLRGIPFRVVALLGMNDGAFPRADRPPTFDRIAAAPRAGDPSLRDEDRYLFLETLLAARERLLVSYLGRSAKDDRELPPSVVVSELLDTVAEGFRHPEGKLPGALVTVHRLQAFHPDYFRAGSGLASASAENLAGARALTGPKTEPLVLAPEPLPEPEEPWREVDLATLTRFYHHPARFFLQRCLGVQRLREAAGAEEREPFAVGSLERYGILGSLTERCLTGADPAATYPVLRAAGELPPGRPGEVAFAVLAGEAQGLAETVRGRRAGDELPPLDVDLRVGPYRLSGRLPGLYPGARVCHRPAKLEKKGRDQAVGWLEHLVLCAARRDGDPDRTVLVGLDKMYGFRPADGALEHLERLLDLYGAGLREPLPLLPTASLAYAEAVCKDQGEDKALDAARTAWEGGYRSWGDREDADLQMCFRSTDPLGKRFRELALAVFGPLLEHRENR